MAGRKSIPADSDPFGDAVAYAWSMTTRDQREMCRDDFVKGRKSYHEQVALLLHLTPDALLLASLLEFEHESVCGPDGRPLDTHYGRLRERMNRWKPVDNCPKTVDNSALPVDKSVDKPVDKSASYPQGETIPDPARLES